MLYNHLAYAALRCSDQGFVTLGNLLTSEGLDTRPNVLQLTNYREAALVAKGPARDAFHPDRKSNFIPCGGAVPVSLQQKKTSVLGHRALCQNRLLLLLLQLRRPRRMPRRRPTPHLHLTRDVPPTLTTTRKSKRIMDRRARTVETPGRERTCGGSAANVRRRLQTGRGGSRTVRGVRDGHKPLGGQRGVHQEH